MIRCSDDQMNQETPKSYRFSATKREPKHWEHKQRSTPSLNPPPSHDAISAS